MDYESQNAVLQRHVDSLHGAISRLEADTDHQKEANKILQQHLDSLRDQLAVCFSSIPLTGTLFTVLLCTYNHIKLFSFQKFLSNLKVFQ